MKEACLDEPSVGVARSLKYFGALLCRRAQVGECQVRARWRLEGECRGGEGEVG